jgi:azurin
MTEALWVHQWHDAFDRELLQSMLSSRDPHARAAATRVLCYWRDRAPDALPMLEERAHDPHPRVRLEAVRAASFFRVPEAAYVALAALNHPTDYYIDYVIRESIRQLEPQWRDDLDAIANSNRAGFDYLLRTITTPDLLKRPLTPAIAQALLARADVADADRHKALAVLSEEHGISAPAALLDVLDATGDDAGAKANVVKTLPQFPPRELKPLRSRLSELATTAKPATVRQYAWAALATADEGFGTIWDADRLDVIESVPLVYDPFIRARAYEKVIPLLLSDEPVPPLTRQAGIRAAVSISRDHARTFAALANLILRGEEIPAAASALRSLPRSVLTPDQCAAIAPHLLSWARAVPVEQRTSAQYLATVQFTEGLVTLLPPLRASEVLNSLRDLRVAVFVVGTVREQMRYDTPRLVVEAGKPFEITFANTDLMPHNLTIVTPGSRKRIGEAAMKMKPDQHDDAGRAFVPSDPAILAATKLLENGQRETLKLTAPQSEGDYEYVCTYPDHWQVMWGRLVVTNDIDAYLRSHPDKPSAPTPTPSPATKVVDVPGAAHHHH